MTELAKIAMSEAEWLASDNPIAMFRFIRGPRAWQGREKRSKIEPAALQKAMRERVTERKLYLFGFACLKYVSPVFTDEPTQKAVDVIERMADGGGKDGRSRATRDARHAFYEAKDAGDEARHCAGVGLYRTLVASDAGIGVMEGHLWALAAANATKQVVTHTAEAMQVRLLRDIFGNPFRPVAINPVWRSSNVVSLARTIYDNRSFDRLPELADALLAAGCDNQEIIDHCRSDGPHVRGCWVVDLVLGKE